MNYRLFCIALMLMILVGCGSSGGDNDASISVNPVDEAEKFIFTQDTGNRSDKVVGRMYFTVTDNDGGYIRNLSLENFTFLERDFGSDDEYSVEVEATQDSGLEVYPMNVLYLIDTSYSVAESGADTYLIKQANNLAMKIKEINNNMSSADITKYITFSDNVGLAQTSNSSTPFSNLQFDDDGGGTALYQAMHTALEELKGLENPLLFVFTDGRENASPAGFDKDLVIQTAQEYGVKVFIAGLGDVDKDALTDIAVGSNGYLGIAKTSKQLASAFEHVLENIPVTYNAIYRPTQRSGHKEFRFKVTYKYFSGFIVDDFDVDGILQGTSN